MLLSADSCRTYLNEELARRMRLNPSYSQRAFARSLGLSPGELSELLRGKRGLSLKSALRISSALGLSPAEAKYLLYLAQVERGRRFGAEAALAAPEPEAGARQLTLDMFHVVSDWYCFAVYNLADCEGFRADPAWIARRLGISRGEARLALERLERIGLFERKRGRLVASADWAVSPSGIPSEAIRNYHRRMLEKAIESLETQSVSERDVGGAGFAVDPRHVESVKKEISEFRDQLVAKYSRGRRSEVYQLEIAFFRLTQATKERR